MSSAAYSLHEYGHERGARAHAIDDDSFEAARAIAGVERGDHERLRGAGEELVGKRASHMDPAVDDLGATGAPHRARLFIRDDDVVESRRGACFCGGHHSCLGFARRFCFGHGLTVDSCQWPVAEGVHRVRKSPWQPATGNWQLVTGNRSLIAAVQMLSRFLAMHADRARHGRVDEAELPEALHERGDARARGADHLREVFLRDLIDALPRAFDDAEFFGEMQEDLRQSSLAVHRREVERGDLTIDYAGAEVAEEGVHHLD